MSNIHRTVISHSKIALEKNKGVNNNQTGINFEAYQDQTYVKRIAKPTEITQQNLVQFLESPHFENPLDKYKVQL